MNINLQSHFLTYNYTIWKNRLQNMTDCFGVVLIFFCVKVRPQKAAYVNTLGGSLKLL